MLVAWLEQAVVLPGLHPRLFIDMVAFGEMARDRRTYRLVQDRRHVRAVLHEGEGVTAMVGPSRPISRGGSSPRSPPKRRSGGGRRNWSSQGCAWPWMDSVSRFWAPWSGSAFIWLTGAWALVRADKSRGSGETAAAH